MDTDQIYQHARSRFEHAASRRSLKEKYEAKMLFAYAGGMWQAGPDLLSTLLACPDTEAVILDMYEIPVKVQTRELHQLAQQHWQEQMNAWLIEYQDLSRFR